MDLCNKLPLMCSLFILLSFTLHIFTSPGYNAKETYRNRIAKKYQRDTTEEENDSYNYSTNISNGLINSSTIPNQHASTNSTVYKSSQHTSPTPSPEITTHQITGSTTKANFATLQSASDPTRKTDSTTLGLPVSTTHSSNESTSKSTYAYFSTGMAIDNKTNNETGGVGLNQSEMSLTILFSVALGVIVLIILGLSVYKMTRSKGAQYSHRPLHNEETGGQFTVTDDTLVISGGLYDGPQIYNATVTALNEDPPFTYTPTQFKLEILHEDHMNEASAFKTIQQEP